MATTTTPIGEEEPYDTTHAMGEEDYHTTDALGEEEPYGEPASTGNPFGDF